MKTIFSCPDGPNNKRFCFVFFAAVFILCSFMVVASATPALAGECWPAETITGVEACNYSSLSFSLNHSGYPCMAFTVDYNNPTLKYSFKDASGWHTETVISMAGSDAIIFPQMALDPSDNPHIVYLNAANPPFEVVHVYKDSSGWHTETVDNDVSRSNIALAMDASGAPGICYTSGDGLKLKYAYKDAEGWHIENALDGWIANPSLVYDSSGNPHVCYGFYDDNNTDAELEYAFKDAYGWHSETIEKCYVTHPPSLALDHSGSPIISYTLSLSVKYAYKDASGWHSEVIDDDGCIYTETSLALDSFGNPHICYNRYFDLMHSYKSTGWNVDTVAVDEWPEYNSGTDIGLASLVIDAFDVPHVGYFLHGVPRYSYRVTDDSPPSINNFTINDGAAFTVNSNVALYISATDDQTTMEQLKVRFSNDNQNWSNWMDLPGVNWDLPSDINLKTIYAQVADLAGNIAATQANIQLCLFNVNLEEDNINCGVIATVTSTSSGIAEPQYQFWVKSPRDDTWVLGSDYSDENSYSFTENVPGSYQIIVWVKSQGMSYKDALPSQGSYVTFLKNNAVYSLDFTSHQGANQTDSVPWPPGTNAEFVVAAGDNGGNPMYEFWVHDASGWHIAQNWSSNNTFSMDNLSPGSYTISVNALDSLDIAAGNWNAAFVKTVVMNIGSGVTLSAPESVAAGDTVNLTAQAFNFTGAEYQFWYQTPDKVWHQSGDYTINNSFSFTANISGTYRAAVYAKDHYAPGNVWFAICSTTEVNCK